ncbi:DUF2191 domain-containing protein [Echinicola rosea]|uniref:DUF2191 domain-containing protein n=1 Tax=Echinicola rosea TaxID=1807691 RepID=A0ABQ1UEQ1_9BACT|nr:DUF2191 domain-containing protein [Echinicola rosea]GGF16302.1 hypothetical protein GCM10011339_00220 [Echinicola rosea]
MKITAIIEDRMIEELIKETGAKTITDGLKVAIKDYLSKRKIQHLSSKLVNEPLEFSYGADHLREQNRE